MNPNVAVTKSVDIDLPELGVVSWFDRNTWLGIAMMGQWVSESLRIIRPKP